MGKISEASKDDILSLQSIKNHPEDVFHTYFERGRIFMAHDGQYTLGYTLYNNHPKYGLYARLGIPEIQDLNVHPDHRRHGHATALITRCEDEAKAQGHDMIGLSVGLSASYGPAQIMYHRLGYMPDGNGVTYNRGQVSHGQVLPVDDDLCLMLIKTLT